MAIRGAGQRPAAGSPQVRGITNALANALQGAGVLLPGQNAKALAQHIIKNLLTQGYGGKTGGPLLEQLGSALKSAQRAHGLQTSGTLDKATVSLLKSLGVLATVSKGPGGVLEAKDGFVRAQPKNATKTNAPQTQSPAPSPSVLENLARGLEGRFGKLGAQLAGALRGLAGAGGALSEQVNQVIERVRDAVANVVNRVGAEAGGRASNTALPPAATANPTAAAAHTTPQNTRGDASERARSDARGLKDPSDRGAPVGDALSKQGRGKPGRHAGVFGGGEGEGSPVDGEEGDGASLEDEDDASERDSGNAPSGDEDFADARRGHSSLDDDSDDDEGFYEIPSFAEQVADALTQISRDAASATQATTYSWDLMLYKPGVYGRRQKGEEMIHLEVRQASPFDPVWEQAHREIARILRRYQPDAVAPSRADIEIALRRARVRED